MKIIGCDFHPGYQQIAMRDQVTGETLEKALSHERKEEVRAFYAGLEKPVRVGIEASGQSQWFERLLTELGHEVWIGDAAKIRASCERKQKTDRRDAELLVKLLDEERFPRIWVPTPEERDARQLLLHRAKLVRMRTQIKNQLQALAMNQGVQRKWKLWSAVGRKQLESLPLLPFAGRRRTELLALHDQLEAAIDELDRAVGEQGQKRPAVRRLMTHPGVGPITALAFVLTLGPATRFRRGKQVASYFGLIPTEHSSGDRGQRLGHISKQGSSFLRGLLVEAAQSAVRHEPGMRREYHRLAQRKCRGLAKVAMARKLAVRLYWMLRLDVDYAQLLQGSHAGQLESFRGRG
ncbi:MAG TPA: IS110 family transposase [Candidatus Acidoferrum sp.]|jgi:transposase